MRCSGRRASTRRLQGQEPARKGCDQRRRAERAPPLIADVSTQEDFRMYRAMPILLALLVGLSSANAQEHPNPADKRPALLQALDGHWVMTGDVLGKAVTYDMVAAPILDATFTEVHMKDVQVPAEYEARVFIGVDSDSQVVIAHWLDTFGAKYSIPPGTGQTSEDAIQFTIPYADGPFRDTLTFNPENRTWSLVIESSQPDGSWKHFARYAIHSK
jgi:hypothetical protein